MPVSVEYHIQHYDLGAVYASSWLTRGVTSFVSFVVIQRPNEL